MVAGSHELAGHREAVVVDLPDPAAGPPSPGKVTIVHGPSQAAPSLPAPSRHERKGTNGRARTAWTMTDWLSDAVPHITAVRLDLRTSVADGALLKATSPRCVELHGEIG